MKFTKMHGLGNDFIFIDRITNPSEDHDWSALAVKWCNRREAIGADGIILIEKTDVADFSMRLFNSDGTEGLMCGNASRCLGKYVFERKLTKQTEVSIITKSGIKILKLHVQNGQVTEVTVDMGMPILDTAKIPARLQPSPYVNGKLTLSNKEAYNITLVSMGNPHCVVFVDDVDAVDLEKAGPLFEHHELFPDRINTEFVQPVNGVLKMRVWERGAGATMACGTGACATLVAAVLNNIVDKKAVVAMPGGSLTIEWDKTSNKIYMTGTAAFAFEGEADI